MTYHTAKSQSRSSGKTLADIVTYRYHGELVYVPAAHDYVQALSHARDAFPQLRKLHDASLSLSLTSPAHEQKLVGISAPAWPTLIAHMSRYQVIDVLVTGAAVPIPHIVVNYADGDGDGDGCGDAERRMEPAPPYRGPDAVDDGGSSRPRPPLVRSPSSSSSSSSLNPGRRNWLFQKLHGD